MCCWFILEERGMEKKRGKDLKLNSDKEGEEN